ncbi:MAG TPA: PEP-CTERM sorting domain-containing protein [Fimbriimonadaceae bacterium]|nr:PEP-CTERM sorting domain-containing protein [Fimbriimonadaceae bacterium]
MFRETGRSLRPILSLAFLSVLAAAGSALTINTTFVASGQSFGSGLGNATGAPTSNTTGSGNLQTIFRAAADCWESVILDNHTVNLTFGWQALSGGTLGVHVLTGQGGNPNRETSGVIRFDSDASAPFFLDATPHMHEEYGDLNTLSQNLGGGAINVARIMFSEHADADNSFDLFSTALHEIGHSLGLSGANSSFIAENGDLDIDVTAPRPFAGSAIPTISGAHLDLDFALMFPGAFVGERLLMSEADIVANAQISGFSNLDLDGCLVPEPASMAALGMGIAVLIRRRRK